jgi:hypothetical protein
MDRDSGFRARDSGPGASMTSLTTPHGKTTFDAVAMTLTMAAGVTGRWYPGSGLSWVRGVIE